MAITFFGKRKEMRIKRFHGAKNSIEHKQEKVTESARDHAIVTLLRREVMTNKAHSNQ